MRFFNTEGPNRPLDHYCLPPLKRWDFDEVLALIDRKKYFLLHAPRQTGNTTCMLALMEHLSRTGRFRALYANIEGAQTARGRVARDGRNLQRAQALGAALSPRPGARRLVSRRRRSGPGRGPSGI
jgi:hypothetical protein